MIVNHNNRHIGITLLNNISKNSEYFGVRVELNKYTNNQLIKIHEFVPRASVKVFTNREQDIVN